ncbi:TPA: DUF262 domain-containing protein [Serratia fonticola]
MQIKERDERAIIIYNDIKSNEINIRPDFQRGEVWPSPKKKMLIDTMLREWPIPPIHLVRVEDGSLEVLDGQQRLTAIRDFIENRIAIDGTIQPFDEDIYSMNGLKYKKLSEEQRKKFDRYTLSVYEITNYNQGEPGEIFHRLNQSVKLTSSEQRNSFYGELRDQTSSVVKMMIDYKVDKGLLGFSNSRMAYNDLIARVGYLLEENSLRATISDKVLNLRFRDDRGFEQDIIISIQHAINFLSEIRKNIDSKKLEINLTKASSLNWIYTLSLHSDEISDNIDKAFISFLALETAKNAVKSNKVIDDDTKNFFGFSEAALRELLLIYIERSSSRVMTTTSIIIRDIIISLALFKSNLDIFDNQEKITLNELSQSIEISTSDVKELIENLAEKWKTKNA